MPVAITTPVSRTAATGAAGARSQRGEDERERGEHRDARRDRLPASSSRSAERPRTRSRLPSA